MTMNSLQQLESSKASWLLAQLEGEIQRRRTESRLTDYKPYPRQAEFHAAGRDHRERLLMAGNQLGKTLAAGFEYAMHATGRYPEWWAGKRYDRPIIGWAAGVTGESTRDNVQRILLGRAGAFGTGAIPKDSIIEVTAARGQPDLQDSIKVRHVSGGVSHIALKSYEKGREKWQGETLDICWFDEEPGLDIYLEGLTRTNTTLGPVLVTFTPLLGMSDVVKRYMLDKVPGTHITRMSIDDVTHYTEEQRAAIIASYPEYSREARTRGIPQLGSGRVFPLSDNAIRCQAFPLPEHWPRINGIDFGWDHPSAGVQCVWDRDSDCLYVIAAHRAREQTPAMFAAAVKPWGKWPWSWPHDGLQHDRSSGDQLATLYKAQGLEMLPVRATFEDGTSGLEAGVMDMLDRMQTGRLKVFTHLNDWFEEFNLYHRKDGLIVKENDDLLSATRYALMMRRYAKTGVELKRVRKLVPDMQGSAQGWMA